MLSACATLGATASVALAGTDTNTCGSTYGTPCYGPYPHHFIASEGYYTGSGNLPLKAGMNCDQSGGCGSFCIGTNGVDGCGTVGVQGVSWL